MNRLILCLLFAVGRPQPVVVTVEREARHFAQAYVRPPPLPVDAKRASVGKSLFFDPRLSAASNMSCSTCHNPALSFGDGLPRAIGQNMKALSRRSPTILDVGYGGPFMWDGRFETLEEQALGPITSAGEMNLTAAQLGARLNDIPEYREALSTMTVGEAIAAYERTIVSPPAPFDLWVNGAPEAISEQAKRGFLLFNSKAECSKCHAGWRFTDDSFHDIGVADADLGRGGLKDFQDFVSLQHAFKTPTLRNVELRAPYFHDGSTKTLDDVLQLYNSGGAVKRESLAPEMKRLNLTPSELAELDAFLKTLTSQLEVTLPALPR